MTTLNDSVAKISTKVYGGGGEIAEQRAAGSAVVWRHGDAVTGSFNTTTQAGYLYQENEAEFNSELEPLGSVLPETDPYFAPGTEPMPKAFHGAGGGFAEDPESGCLWDGAPIRCDLVNIATNSSRDAHWEVNIRTPGGYQLQTMLQGSVWRYDRYCEGDCGEYIDGGTNAPSGFEDPDTIRVDTNRVYINSFYVIYGADLLTNFIRGGDDKINPIFIRHMDDDKENELTKRILEITYYARDSKKCTDAFIDAGATPIGDQILNTTIVPENVFSMEADDVNWTRGSDIGKEMRENLTSTTNDLSWPGLYGDTGWRFIGLTNRTIESNDDYLSVIIIHSFVHSGGIPGKDDQTWGELFWGINPHDLRYLGEKYKDILKHCTKEGHSKALGQ